MDPALHSNKHQIENKFLKVLSEVNGLLIQYNNWYKAIEKCIGLIGNSLDVDRAYYFENHLNAAGNHVVSQRLEWTRVNVNPQIDNQ